MKTFDACITLETHINKVVTGAYLVLKNLYQSRISLNASVSCTRHKVQMLGIINVIITTIVKFLATPVFLFSDPTTKFCRIYTLH